MNYDLMNLTPHTIVTICMRYITFINNIYPWLKQEDKDFHNKNN